MDRNRRERKSVERWDPSTLEKKKRRKKRKLSVSPKKAKATKKKAAESPAGAGVKGKSAYGLFAEARRLELGRSAEKKNATKQISAEWKAMAEAAKATFKAEARRLKERDAAFEAAEAARAQLKRDDEERRKRAREERQRLRKLEDQQRQKEVPFGDAFFDDDDEEKKRRRNDDSFLDERRWVFEAHRIVANRRVKCDEYSDDHCSVCAEGGKLLLCRGCPRAYHAKCLSGLGVPAPGDSNEADRNDTSGDLFLGNKRQSASSSKKTNKNKKKDHAHAPDPSALVGGKSSLTQGRCQGDDDDWHCPCCVATHVEACVFCGEAADDETRLVPCVACPRAYHFRCCNNLELVDVPGESLAFRCAECRPPQGKSQESQDQDDGGEAEDEKKIALLTDDEKKDSSKDSSSSESPASPCSSEDEVIAAPAPKKRRLGAALEDETLRKIASLCATLPRSHFASVFGSRLARTIDLATSGPDDAAAARTYATLPTLHDAEAVCSRLHFAEMARGGGSSFGGDDGQKRLRGSVGAAAWDDAVATTFGASRRAQFAVEGICCVPSALSSASVASLRDAAIEYYRDATHTIAQLNLEDDLEAGGFATFKARDRGRFDLVVPGFVVDDDDDDKGQHPNPNNNKSPDFGGCLADDEGTCPWLAEVRRLIGSRARLCHVGVIIALENAVSQAWHSDGDHIHDTLHLPPHAVNVFVPLVDVDVTNGATEFAPGSHLDWGSPDRLLLEAKAGDAVIFDWRIKHRGLANKVSAPRPLLYLTYGLPFFVDRYNFSSDRYAPLPPLVPRVSREDRAKSRRRQGPTTKKALGEEES